MLHDGFEEGSAFSFYKGPDNKYLDLVSHPFSVVTIHLCCFSTTAMMGDVE